MAKKSRKSQRDYDFDFLVFIGRFQPFHNGHLHVVLEALKRTKHLILLIGSANLSRSPKNPFTHGEVVTMIKDSVTPEQANRISFVRLNDYLYNDVRWVTEAQKSVQEAILKVGNSATPHVFLHGTNDFRIGLIGYGKDRSSYYLKLFPQWNDPINVKPVVEQSATDIRKLYLTPQWRDYWVTGWKHDHPIDNNVAGISRKLNVPVGTATFLHHFPLVNEGVYNWLVDYSMEDAGYKAAWSHSPYPPIFSTVDNIVVQSGHILLIRRGAQPGKGLLALPGGYVDQGETLEQSAIRELKEETRIADNIGEIPPAKLRSMIQSSRVFDHPDRSTRGRVITTAFYYKLPDATTLAAVRGDDDAESAQWYPLGTLNPNDFFEDHYHIIDTMLNSKVKEV